MAQHRKAKLKKRSGNAAKMVFKPPHGDRPKKSSISRLDASVLNIELTLVSIIQGVAFYVLVENARQPLAELRYDQWFYVASGLLLIFLFWSRAVAHTLTLIRWPLEFAHNFLYIACTLIEAITLTHLQDPVRWYAFSAVFGCFVWILFVVDLRLINEREREATGPAGKALYQIIRRDQDLNIRVLAPAIILFNLGAAFCIGLWPETFIQRRGHIFFAGAQFLTFALYQIYVLRHFASLTRLIVAASDEEDPKES